MLREDQNRPHRDTVAYIRNTIPPRSYGELQELNLAYETYIRAKTDFWTVNSDRTMINLIGTWARLNRVIMILDDKYGSRQ